MGSRPEVMDDAAQAVGLDELCDKLVKRAQRSGELRKDLEWEDIPMIACGLGRITPAEHGPGRRPLAAAGRDHPRRPARARQLEAAEAASAS